MLGLLQSKKAGALILGALLLVIADKLGVGPVTIEALKGLAYAYLLAQGSVDTVTAFKGGK